MTKLGLYQEDLDLIDVLIAETEETQWNKKLWTEEYYQKRLNSLRSLWFRVEEYVDKKLLDKSL